MVLASFSSFINNGWIEDFGTGLIFAIPTLYTIWRKWTSHIEAVKDRHQELMARHDAHDERLSNLEARIG